MYLVYGLQRSGISVIKYLKKNNLKFRIWDDDIIVRKKIKKNFDEKFFFNPINKNLGNFKKIIVSPGISLRQNIFKIKDKLNKINRDTNIYISNLVNKKIIAVTGTNGKSTTTKLIGDILKKNKIETFVGGNIGKPLCNSLISNKNYKFHVVELSSFQLETVKNFNSKISIITNIASDHLDKYNNINDYISQKKNIISKEGTNIISIDDKYSKRIFFQKNIKNKISFSILDKSADIYMEHDYILDNYFKKNRKLYIKNISRDLNGHFNNQNIVIAYICIKLLKLSEKNFLRVIKNFTGLPFRSKIIFENSRLRIINNSKSTNINSAVSSIDNYNNIFLILGGTAKEKNFEIFNKYKNKLICIYLYGKSASNIEKKLNKSLNVKKFKNLNLVINQLFKDVEKINVKSNILFAPACTSFDQYKNFEERGKHFTKLINKKILKL